MRLSEQLKQDHDSGDFGKALEGYAERAAELEKIAEAVAHIGVDLDAACIMRLRDRAGDFGSEGRIVRELLDIIERLLEL